MYCSKIFRRGRFYIYSWIQHSTTRKLQQPLMIADMWDYHQFIKDCCIYFWLFHYGHSDEAGS